MCFTVPGVRCPICGAHLQTCTPNQEDDMTSPTTSPAGEPVYPVPTEPPEQTPVETPQEPQPIPDEEEEPADDEEPVK